MATSMLAMTATLTSIPPVVGRNGATVAGSQSTRLIHTQGKRQQGLRPPTRIPPLDRQQIRADHNLPEPSRPCPTRHSIRRVKRWTIRPITNWSRIDKRVLPVLSDSAISGRVCGPVRWRRAFQAITQQKKDWNMVRLNSFQVKAMLIGFLLSIIGSFCTRATAQPGAGQRHQTILPLLIIRPIAPACRLAGGLP